MALISVPRSFRWCKNCVKESPVFISLLNRQIKFGSKSLPERNWLLSEKGCVQPCKCPFYPLLNPSEDPSHNSASAYRSNFCSGELLRRIFDWHLQADRFGKRTSDSASCSRFLESRTEWSENPQHKEGYKGKSSDSVSHLQTYRTHPLLTWFWARLRQRLPLYTKYAAGNELIGR